MAFAIGAAVILGFYVLQNTQSTAQHAAAGTPTSPAGQQAQAQTGDNAEDAPDTPAITEPSTQPTPDSPAGVDRGNGFAQPSPDADQAPVQPTPEQYERQNITMPPALTPDPQDPVAVASAFLTVYNSRATETDDSWQEATGSWLVPDLAAQLPLVGNGALEGKTPAAVRSVDIGDNVEDWGVDTPLRWAHHVQVTVDTQDQGTYLLEYRVRSQLTERGWLINAAPLDTWQRVVD